MKGQWRAPHKVYCYLLNILIKILHSPRTTFLLFEFLGIGINNYF